MQSDLTSYDWSSPSVDSRSICSSDTSLFMSCIIMLIMGRRVCTYVGFSPLTIEFRAPLVLYVCVMLSTCIGTSNGGDSEGS